MRMTLKLNNTLGMTFLMARFSLCETLLIWNKLYPSNNGKIKSSF